METMILANLLMGAALLLWGRRLFWLFVAGVGFVAGATFATDVLQVKPDWLVLAIALAAGIIGALASVVMQYVVVAVAGFLAGGYVVHAWAFAVGFQSPEWIGFLVGGVIGAVLVLVLLDWALILLSTLVGATIIVQNTTLERPLLTALFFVLCMVGIVAQERQMRAAPPKAKSS